MIGKVSVIVEEGYDGLHEELWLEQGRWVHFMPPDCRDGWDTERPITAVKARELLAKAKVHALHCLAAIQKELARCEEFERLLSRPS